MSYLNNSCDCSYNKIQNYQVQCKRCEGSLISNELKQKQTQKLIWNVSRASSSLYTMNLASQSVVGGINNIPVNGMNWNNMSDRANPSVIPTTMNIPRRRTRLIPGQLSAAGTGVDVKHNSYHRYLARKKAPILKTYIPSILPQPIEGNKQYMLGFISNCNC